MSIFIKETGLVLEQNGLIVNCFAFATVKFQSYTSFPINSHLSSMKMIMNTAISELNPGLLHLAGIIEGV